MHQYPFSFINAPIIVPQIHAPISPHYLASLSPWRLLSYDLTIFNQTMLRNKPRVTSKQASLMANQHQSSKPNSSSLFNSPKFRFFTSKFDYDNNNFSILSPTSILDANPSSIFSSQNTKPTCYFEPTIPNPQKFHSKDAFGLADLVKTNQDHISSKQHVNKMVLFGSKLRVQIPSSDFGTKTGTRNPLQAKVLTLSEIDQTEDYTRVISHGPNPTITHIFDNSVFVETSPCSISLQPLKAIETNKMENDFLSYCYTCKKNLDQKQDIYIYRGEKGFCSSECRYQEMLLDQMET